MLRTRRTQLMHMCSLTPAQDLAQSILSDIFYQSGKKELLVLSTSWHQERWQYFSQCWCAARQWRCQQEEVKSTPQTVQLRERPARTTAKVAEILDCFVEFLFSPVLKEQ